MLVINKLSGILCLQRLTYKADITYSLRKSSIWRPTLLEYIFSYMKIIYWEKMRIQHCLCKNGLTSCIFRYGFKVIFLALWTWEYQNTCFIVLSSIIGSLNLYIHCAAVLVAEQPPAAIIIALERMELLHSVLGIFFFFTKQHRHHEMVLTHLSLRAFVCILPEHLGTWRKRVKDGEEKGKIENKIT